MTMYPFCRFLDSWMYLPILFCLYHINVYDTCMYIYIYIHTHIYPYIIYVCMYIYIYMHNVYTIVYVVREKVMIKLFWGTHNRCRLNHPSHQGFGASYEPPSSHTPNQHRLHWDMCPKGRPATRFSCWSCYPHKSQANKPEISSAGRKCHGSLQGWSNLQLM